MDSFAILLLLFVRHVTWFRCYALSLFNFVIIEDPLLIIDLPLLISTSFRVITLQNIVGLSSRWNLTGWMCYFCIITILSPGQINNRMATLTPLWVVTHKGFFNIYNNNLGLCVKKLSNLLIFHQASSKLLLYLF